MGASLLVGVAGAKTGVGAARGYGLQAGIDVSTEAVAVRGKKADTGEVTIY